VRILGIDLSLTAPGLAIVLDGAVTSVESRKTPVKLRDVARLDYLDDLLRAWAASIDVAAMEGPSHGSQAGQSGHHERGGAWWQTKRTLAHLGVTVVVIPPSSLKQYATGKGNAGKAAMCMAAARRFPDVDVPDDDNAVDALWLAAMTADAVGEPPVAMPAAHRAAIDKVADLAELASRGVAA
jgi:Holliday junction resolvasome RuvABC endonuclease subunit